MRPAHLIILKDLMMEGVSTSETSVNFFQTTQRNMLEDSLHYYRHKNLKSRLILLDFIT
jgi:hypothetical protein